MADRDVRLIMKRTSVSGKIPTGTTGTELNFIKQGELASNLSDKKLFSYDGSNVFEFGSSSFFSLTGGTISGNTIINGNLTVTGTSVFNIANVTTISGGTLYSGSTNLYDIFEPINKSPYRTFVLTAGTSFNFTGTVNTVSVNKTTGSATQVNLPSSPSIDDFFVVKDRKGDSFLNPITVSGGTNTIDGNTSYIIKIKDKPSLTFLFDGSEYIVI
jgi:hypothetical protein